MKANGNGTVQLQGIGLIDAIKTEDLKPNMLLCWNYSYGEYYVKSIVKVSKCFYELTEVNIKTGEESTRRCKDTKLIGIVVDKEDNIYFYINGNETMNLEEEKEEVENTIIEEEIKEDNAQQTEKNYTALAEEYGLRAWIKTAEYKSSVDGEEFTVVTDLVITKADNTKEVVYRFNFSNNWMKYDNITTIILDVMNYLANTTNEPYWINNTLNKVFCDYNFIVIKLASKQIDRYKEKQRQVEEYKEHCRQVKELEQELNTLTNDLKDVVRVNYNEGIYNIYTRTTLEVIKRDYNTMDSYTCEIKQLKDTIDYLNKIKYCLDNDYDINLMLDAV